MKPKLSFPTKVLGLAWLLPVLAAGCNEPTYTDARGNVEVSPVDQNGMPTGVSKPTEEAVLPIYQLDTDIEINNAQDRDIAHQLDGGDRTTRIDHDEPIDEVEPRSQPVLNDNERHEITCHDLGHD